MAVTGGGTALLETEQGSPCPLLVSPSLSITVLSHTRIRFHPFTGTQSRSVLSPLPRPIYYNPYSHLRVSVEDALLTK